MRGGVEWFNTLILKVKYQGRIENMKQTLIITAIAATFISFSSYGAVRSAVKALSKETSSAAAAKAGKAVPPHKAALTEVKANLEQAKNKFDQAKNNADQAQANLDEAIDSLPEKKRLDEFMGAQPKGCLASIDDAVAARKRKLNNQPRTSGRQERRRTRNTGTGNNASSGVQ